MQQWLICGVVLFVANLSAAAEPVKKVLFIGIDGVRWDAVEKAATPQLDALVAQGTLAVGTEIIAPRETKGDTVSGPGWSNLLCGVWPDKHGVIDNSFKGSNYEAYPHFFTRIKEVRPAVRTASFSNWQPIVEKILSGADVTRDYPAKKLDEYVATDRTAAGDCAELLRNDPVDVTMIYFAQVDESGHRYGFHPSVPQYVQAIETVDEHVGQLRAAIAARKTFAEEDWLILVATDHGGVGLNHGGGRELPEIRRTFLIVSGPAVKIQQIDGPTYQVDCVATALAHLGIVPRAEWQLDGQPVGLKSLPNK